MADASQTQLLFTEETTWGQTPTAALKELRFTSENLTYNIETTTSAEIRSDRQVADLIQTGANSSGGVSFELSYGAYDELIAGVMFSDWSGDSISNGIAQKSFTLEKHFVDAGEYLSYAGMVAGGMSLNISTGSILTGEITFLGRSAESATASVGTGTAIEAPSAEVMNAVDNVGNLMEAGVPMTGVHVSSLTVDLQNNLRANAAIGSLPAVMVGAGQCVVTGNVSVYFENSDLYQKYLNNTATSLSFQVTGAGGSSYTFTLPRIKLTQATIVAGGNDQDVMAEFQYQALRDPTTGVTLTIDRNTVAS
jgi:hypothetical protein